MKIFTLNGVFFSISSLYLNHDENNWFFFTSYYLIASTWDLDWIYTERINFTFFSSKDMSCLFTEPLFSLIDHRQITYYVVFQLNQGHIEPLYWKLLCMKKSVIAGRLNAILYSLQ